MIHAHGGQGITAHRQGGECRGKRSPDEFDGVVGVYRQVNFIDHAIGIGAGQTHRNRCRGDERPGGGRRGEGDRRNQIRLHNHRYLSRLCEATKIVVSHAVVLVRAGRDIRNSNQERTEAADRGKQLIARDFPKFHMIDGPVRINRVDSKRNAGR